MEPVINAATGPVPGAAEDNAVANMAVLCDDLRARGLDVETFIRRRGSDTGDGRYAFDLIVNGTSREILMPGLPAERVRWLEGSPRGFPRLYVDGSSWLWGIALNILVPEAVPDPSERSAAMPWKRPPDLDPEVAALCEAMNLFPGIVTAESCCGHGERPFRIWFTAYSLEALPRLLYWFDACHTSQHGWSVIAQTDCAASLLVFMAEGPRGAYQAAETIAKSMRDAIAGGWLNDGEQADADA